MNNRTMNDLPKKTPAGRTDFNKIKIPTAYMSGAKSDFVSYNEADLSKVNFKRAELSLCEFQGTNLTLANLKQAILILSSFSNETIFRCETEQANVDGSLLLLATRDNGQKVTRQWLIEKGAKNADGAITNLAELVELLSSSKIDADTAVFYSEKINSIYGILNSMKIRSEQCLFIDPNWLSLMQYTTNANLDVLKQAYILLGRFIQEKNQEASVSIRKSV